MRLVQVNLLISQLKVQKVCDSVENKLQKTKTYLNPAIDEVRHASLSKH